MQAIYLDKKDIPAAFRGQYSGQKFKAKVTEKISLHNTWWNSGSRNRYSILNLQTGHSEAIATNSAPAHFGKDYDGTVIETKPGMAVVEHSIFMGEDMGLTFYVHPDNAGKFLPDKGPELTDAEQCLLVATAAYKATYSGRYPRIEMMHRNGFAGPDIEKAKQGLIALGLIKANGAITTAGRNAAPDRSKFKM